MATEQEGHTPGPLDDASKEDMIITLDMLCERLRPIVLGGSASCLNGTPMVPLHIATVTAIYQHLEAARSPNRKDVA